MTVASSTRSAIDPRAVRETLSRHMLVDGFDLVLSLEDSRGVWLRDAASGRDYLDFFTSFASYPMGFNHPKLKEAAFLEKIVRAAVVKPANADLYTAEMAEFVSTFARTIPESLRSRLFFVSGGALAVENALKAAFDWKVRKNIAAGRGSELGRQVIHFRQAFHGRSGYTLSLTNTSDPRKTQYFPKFDWPRISNPMLRFPTTPEVLADVEAAEADAIAQIERALADNPNDIAACIIEPIQGEGGDNHFRPEFLQTLKQMGEEEEFLLIFDEVQTGFGTTGLWWCFEHLGVEPDIFAFGKKTQVCGIAGGPRLDEVDSVFQVSSRINSTWGGNLVDMIRCQRFVEIIEEDDLLQSVREVGAYVLEGLATMAADMPDTVSNVRGRGMFVAFDVPSGDLRDQALGAMRDEGLLALPCGDVSIRFRPPLILEPEHADEGLRRARAGLARVT